MIRSAPHDPFSTARSVQHRTIRSAPHDPFSTARSVQHRTIFI
jgi:hypothetical protein